MKKALSCLFPVLTLTAALLAGCSRASLPLDPAKAVVINEDCDRMAHCSTFLPVGDGTVYFAYYRDTTQTLEAPGKTTIVPVLAKAEGLEKGEVPSFESIHYQEFIHSGETVGDFTQSPARAPYDPNLLLLGDTLMVYFVGCIDGTVTTCVRAYDTVTDRFSGQVDVCTLSYGDKTVPFDTKSFFGMYEDLGFPATFNNDLLVSGAFVPYKGAWYVAVGTAFLPRSCPAVIKTVDGRHFELVMICPDFLYGCCEASVAIWKDEFYVVMRNSGVDLKAGDRVRLSPCPMPDPAELGQHRPLRHPLSLCEGTGWPSLDQFHRRPQAAGHQPDPHQHLLLPPPSALTRTYPPCNPVALDQYLLLPPLRLP